MSKTSIAKVNLICVSIAAACGFVMFDQTEVQTELTGGPQVISASKPSRVEIQAYLATLKGNSINDCLAQQLGKPENHPDIVHSTSPCPVRNLERGHWLRLHFADPGKLPVPYVQSGDLPQSGPRAKDTVTIYLMGGPLEHPDDNLANLAVFRALPEKAVWVFPIYTGTGFRASLDGGADFRLAVKEVSALIKFLRVKYPLARIDLIGASFGSMIATRVNSRDYDRLILLGAPLEMKGTDIEPFFRKVNSAEKIDFDFSSVPIDYTLRRRLIKGFHYLFSIGAEIGNESLVVQSGIRPDCSLLIFGARDHFFGTQIARDPSVFDRFNKVVQLDSGHGVLENPVVKAQTLKAIRDFTCDKDAGRPPAN